VLNKVTNALFHMMPSSMLLIAIGRLPYGYYMLLRVVVPAAALLLAGFIYQRTSKFTIWIGLFLVAAIVFNPVAPLHLTRAVWTILNVAAAALFVGHFIVARSQFADQVD
jgi:hypothetical protein